jgi:hypothetical protein
MSATSRVIKRRRTGWMICVALWLTACGGGVDESSTSGAGAIVQYSVGGTVKGLTGSGLELVNNGTDPVSIAADGTFTFATPLVPGDTYSITVSTQPNAPSQTCTVINGTGTVTTGNVQNLSLNCINKTTTTDVIGGTVEGLLGSGLVLQNNLGDSLNVSANGAFVFATPLAAGITYAVSVLSPPISPYQDCAIADGAGTTGANDVLNVAITCKSNANPAHTVGGSVSGLVSGTTITLLDNGRDAKTISANGAFTFATPIPGGSTYSVTASGAASQQSQACAISNAAGTVASANITNVSVVCTQNAYVAVTVSGLPAGFALQLQDNGSDTLSVPKNGTYAFAGAVPIGSNYAVTISQQPPYLLGQTCTVTNPGGVAAPGTNAVAVACPAPVLASIEVTPAQSLTPKGVNPQFTATGILSDNSTENLTTQVTWTSSNTNAVTITNAAGSNGLATTLGLGVTTITATSGMISGSSTLTVTPATLTAIQVTTATAKVAKGVNPQFVATGIYSDNSAQTLTTQVVWSSFNTAVATISNVAGSKGLATSTGLGVTTITATSVTASGTITGNATLTVTAAKLVAIGVTPATSNVARGLTEQFAAVGVYSDNSTQVLTNQVTWSAATDPPVTVPVTVTLNAVVLPTVVATISNTAGSQGLATALNLGVATISATSDGIVGSTTLTVTEAVLESIQIAPVAPSVPAGLTQQFTATGMYSDNSMQNLTTQVTWAATTTAPAGVAANYAATISNAVGSQGLATTTAAGTVQISATLGSVSGLATLTVTPAVLQSIQITPPAPVAAGFTEQLIATGTYSDQSTHVITTQVTWNATTTAPAGVPADYVATISNAAGSQGLATTTAAGTAAITASSGAIVGNATLTVTNATLQTIAVTPAQPFVPNGKNQQFAATGHYSDQSTQDLTTQVTWSADTLDPTTGLPIAAISNNPGSQGLATAQVEAFTASITATITATLGGISGSATLVVVAPLLQSIAVTPINSQLCWGLPAPSTQQFTATGTYSDNSTGTVSATWSSSDNAVATIDANSGLATGVGSGPVTITAVSGGFSNSAPATGIFCGIG